MAKDPLDQVILVDENDQETGVMDKVKAHQYPVKLHRAISVWLFNKKGEVLLQQRSQKKITAAGWWGNTVCGNLRPGESYLQCAYRRLKEELGIELVQIKPVYKFRYKAYCNDQHGEHEIDKVFVGQYNDVVKPNFEEVKSYHWFELEDLEKLKNTVPSAEESLSLDLEELKSRVAGVKREFFAQEMTFVPWMFMMLQNSELQKALKLA